MSPTAFFRMATLPFAPMTALVARLRRHLAAIEAAHDNQARFAALTEQDHRDLSLPYEGILDAPARDQALPFFLQRRSES